MKNVGDGPFISKSSFVSFQLHSKDEDEDIICYFDFDFKNTTQQNLTSQVLIFCSSNFDCLHGLCDRNISSCQCQIGWTYSNDNQYICNYQQKSKLAAFLLSFFLGGFGADWYYLSVGNAGYIVAGVFKMLTLGGVGIWWLVDWIRILTNSFVDGQGFSLVEWNP